MLKWLKSKAAFIFTIGVYIHRGIEGLNDLRYEFYNAASGLITWGDFVKQIIPTMKFHLSGEFEKMIGQMMKEQHIGLDEEANG